MTRREICTAVALSVLAACRPAEVAAPAPEPREPESVSETPPPALDRPGQGTLIGLYCPSPAGDRVTPLWIRDEIWRGRDDAESAVARGRVRQFSVLGWDGRRTGVFVVAGTAAGEQPVAVGSYAGSSPCSTIGESGPGPDDPVCTRALGGCGVAVASLEPAGGREARPFEEDPDPHPAIVGGACADGERVSADIDGDGRPETFPALELAAGEASMSDRPLSCLASFAAPSIAAKHVRPLDIIAVADFDSDGRHELVVRDGGAVSLFVSTDSAARLMRLGPIALPARADE